MVPKPGGNNRGVDSSPDVHAGGLWLAIRRQTDQAAKTVGPFEPLIQSYGSYREKHGELQFSTHAKDRLNLRGIRLSTEDIKRLSEGVEKAGTKGSQQSLVVFGDKAFIVGVPGRMVITALDRESMKEKVFINIDSAVFV